MERRERGQQLIKTMAVDSTFCHPMQCALGFYYTFTAMFIARMAPHNDDESARLGQKLLFFNCTHILEQCCPFHIVRNFMISDLMPYTQRMPIKENNFHSHSLSWLIFGCGHELQFIGINFLVRFIFD
jgi:hypothetical protein